MEKRSMFYLSISEDQLKELIEMDATIRTAEERLTQD